MSTPPSAPKHERRLHASRSTDRKVIYVFIFAAVVLAAVVVALVRVGETNERQDKADARMQAQAERIEANSERIARVQYKNCVGLREQHLRQNALIDEAIAEEEAKPNLTAEDRQAIEDLRQFRFDVPRCGPAPTE